MNVIRAKSAVAHLAIAGVISLTSWSVAHGQNSGKGKPRIEPDLYEAGAFAFDDQMGDGLASDHGGVYIDGADSVEYVHDLTNWSYAESRGHTGDRTVTIILGACASEACENPFGGAQSANVYAEILVGSFTDEIGQDYLGNGLPGPGEVFKNGGSVTVFFHSGEDAYFLRWDGPNGELIGTGYDDDIDGVADRTVITASEDSRVLLYRRVISTSTRGKKTESTSSWQYAGSYTGMPFELSIMSIGYLRPLPDTTIEY